MNQRNQTNLFGYLWWLSKGSPAKQVKDVVSRSFVFVSYDRRRAYVNVRLRNQKYDADVFKKLEQVVGEPHVSRLMFLNENGFPSSFSVKSILLSQKVL